MSSSNRSALTPAERWVFVISAVAVIFGAIALARNPAELRSIKKDGTGKVTESTTTEQLRSDQIILLTAAGFVLFFIGVNGSRLTKLTVGSVTADLAAPEVKAAEAFAAAPGPIKTVPTSRSGSESDLDQLAPDGSPSGKVIFQGEVWHVYSAQGISAKAAQRVLDSWPSDTSPKPDSFTNLSFALASQRGNEWQWLLKFANRPAVALK
jgi:hypothetical protein